jgi:hypothetical protein
LADVLLARTDGQFDQHSFEATAGGPEDFVNGDGRFELLWGAWYHAEDGHTYWAYRLIDPAVGWRLHDGLLPSFPTIIPFTHRPNAMPAAVSDAVREALLQQSTSRWQFGWAMVQMEPDVMSTSSCEVAQIDLDRDGSQESVQNARDTDTERDRQDTQATPVHSGSACPRGQDPGFRSRRCVADLPNG